MRLPRPQRRGQDHDAAHPLRPRRRRLRAGRRRPGGSTACWTVTASTPGAPRVTSSTWRPGVRAAATLTRRSPRRASRPSRNAGSAPAPSGRAGGSRSPLHCWPSRTSSCSTSPPPGSIRTRCVPCARNCGRTPTAAAPCCSRATCSRRSPRPATASWSSPRAGGSRRARSTPSSPSGFRLRSPEAPALLEALKRHGLDATADGPGTVIVSGADPDAVGRAVRDSRAVLHEMSTQGALEALYVGLTS